MTKANAEQWRSGEAGACGLCRREKYCHKPCLNNKERLATIAVRMLEQLGKDPEFDDKVAGVLTVANQLAKSAIMIKNMNLGLDEEQSDEV